MASDSTQKWNGRSRGGRLGNWFFVVTLKYLGLRAAYTLLFFVAPYFVPFAPKASRSVWRYNRHILGYGSIKSIAKIFVTYYRFGQTLIDKVAMVHGITKPFKYIYDNYDAFLEQLNDDSTIIIGAHVGRWEAGTPFFREYGKHLNIVMYDAEYKQIKDIIEKDATHRDFKIIPLNDDGIESIIKIKNALDRHEYVCFQGDRFMNDKNALEATFMDHKALFPKGLFQLASRMRVTVAFFFAMREKGRCYRFIFKIATILPNSEKKPEEQLLEQYIKQLESIVKRYPQQWFNFYDFWLEYK